MLQIESIHKTFYPGTIDEKVLFTDFNLTIRDREFVTVIGSNGSGKTTLLNLIAGDIKPDGGKILLDGKDLSPIPNFRRARDIGRVFQNPAVGTCPGMTIWENLSIADNKAKSFGLSFGLNRKRKEFYQSQLELLGMGLENRMNTKAGTLSGGQRQALALVMATLVKPDLLLLDEHTAALDPKSSDIVMELTDRVIREKGITALMITHNLKYALDYTSRFIMLHEGNIVLEKSGQEKAQMTADEILETFHRLQIIGE